MTPRVNLRGIVTQHQRPPIPTRLFDWMATREGYDAGDPIGTGPTEAEAVADLREQEDERGLTECSACEGQGRIEVGESGSHYRDGERYDPPGWEACEACNGEGRVPA